jgi:hypothetical protein
LEEQLDGKIEGIISKEMASFKNVNINVRSMHHRQIVIQQAEKLRDGFFLKTKTNVSLFEIKFTLVK